MRWASATLIGISLLALLFPRLGHAATFPVTGSFDLTVIPFPALCFNVSGAALTAGQCLGAFREAAGPASGGTGQASIFASFGGYDDLGGHLGSDGTLDDVSGNLTGQIAFQSSQSYTLPVSTTSFTVSGIPGTFSATLTAYAADIDGLPQSGSELWTLQMSGIANANLYYSGDDITYAEIDIDHATATDAAPEPGTLQLFAVALIGMAGTLLWPRRRTHAREEQKVG